MHVIASGAALGADITDIDLSLPLDQIDADAITHAWTEHLVLRFRGQSLSDDELMTFSANFGTLDKRPVGRARQDSRPGNHYVTVISNVVENGRPIGGLGNLESQWHVDMSYNPSPAVGSILHALEIPKTGGNTGFCSMYAAWEGLNEDLQDRLRGMRLKHDAAHNSVGGLRAGFDHAANPTEAPGAVHPVVRRHPASGRDGLYLGRRNDAHFEGLSLVESDALLDEVWRQATQPQYCWEQVWQVGDVGQPLRYASPRCLRQSGPASHAQNPNRRRPGYRRVKHRLQHLVGRLPCQPILSAV